MINRPGLYRFVWIRLFNQPSMTDVNWQIIKDKFPPQSNEDIDELTYGLRKEKDFDSMLKEAEESVDI